QDRCRDHSPVLRLRTGSDRDAAPRRPGQGSDLRRRFLPPRSGGGNERDGRSRARQLPEREEGHRAPPGRARDPVDPWPRRELGGTMVLYEGTPDYPAADRLWRMVERHKVTVLGVSPTLVRGLMTHGDEMPAHHDLSSLRVLGGTGEPWNPEPFNWYFRHIGGG